MSDSVETILEGLHADFGGFARNMVNSFPLNQGQGHLNAAQWLRIQALMMLEASMKLESIGLALEAAHVTREQEK